MIPIARSGFLVAIFMCMSAIANARESVPIVDSENNAIPMVGGKELTLEAVANAIKAGGASQQYPWVPTGNSPGEMELTTLVRGKHTAVVKVTYDTKTYSIRYASSVNLNYKTKKDTKTKKEVPLIHPAYNDWVQQLKAAIDFEFKKLAAA